MTADQHRPRRICQLGPKEFHSSPGKNPNQQLQADGVSSNVIHFTQR